MVLGQSSIKPQALLFSIRVIPKTQHAACWTLYACVTHSVNVCVCNAIFLIISKYFICNYTAIHVQCMYCILKNISPSFPYLEIYYLIYLIIFCSIYIPIYFCSKRRMSKVYYRKKKFNQIMCWSVFFIPRAFKLQKDAKAP